MRVTQATVSHTQLLGCATVNDAQAIEAKIDSFISDVVSELPDTAITT